MKLLMKPIIKSEKNKIIPNENIQSVALNETK